MKNTFLEQYQKFCKKTSGDMGSSEKEIMTWGLGISGEAGDVAGCIKKTYSHKNNQKDGIKENLGDTLWYIAMICNFYGWTLEEVMNDNIKKLEKRYPNGFTKKDAGRRGTRVDWGEK